MNYQRSQIHEKKLSSYLKIGAGVAALVILFFLWISWAGSTPVNVDRTVKIPKGTSVSNIDTLLKVKISHTRYKLWKAFFAPSINLQTGVFAMPENTNTLSDFFIAMKNPAPTEEDITLLPGWHKGEISEAFRKKEITGDLIAEESSIIAALSGKYPFLNGKSSLEGFLMPDTYRIANGTDVKTIVDSMLANFQKRIYTPFLATGKPVDAFYDVLSLASIVQEEENSKSQMPTVADILKKRLRQGWQIGADITVCYPELVPGSDCQKYVNNYYSLSREARSAKNNPYDTRDKIGLPPTPIASLTADTFFATLNATAETPAWFYLHDKNGVIHTAITGAEHEQNKSTYLR